VTPVSRDRTNYSDVVKILDVRSTTDGHHLEGVVTIHPSTGQRVTTIQVSLPGGESTDKIISRPVGDDGHWIYDGEGPLPGKIQVLSPNGGYAVFNRDARLPGPVRTLETRPAKRISESVPTSRSKVSKRR
jgi:hypothetical protein